MGPSPLRALSRAEGRQVAKYSRFVRAMRWALPGMAVLLLLAIFISPSLQPDVRTIAAPEQTTREMLNPRYSGFNSSGAPFTLTADKAVQAEDNLSLINLSNLKTEMTGANGGWSRLSADSGVYDQSLNQIDLSGHVRVQNADGYDIVTGKAHVNLPAGTAHGEQPVSGMGPMGKINAQGFQMDDKGKTIIFTGRPDLQLESRKP